VECKCAAAAIRLEMPEPLDARAVCVWGGGSDPQGEAGQRHQPVTGSPDGHTAKPLPPSRSLAERGRSRPPHTALPSGEQWRAYDKTRQARPVALPSVPRGEVEVGPNMGGGVGPSKWTTTGRRWSSAA
jgi:hypothetical protein